MATKQTHEMGNIQRNKKMGEDQREGDKAAAEPKTKDNKGGGVVGRSFRKRELLRM